MCVPDVRHKNSRGFLWRKHSFGQHVWFLKVVVRAGGRKDSSVIWGPHFGLQATWTESGKYCSHLTNNCCVPRTLIMPTPYVFKLSTLFLLYKWWNLGPGRLNKSRRSLSWEGPQLWFKSMSFWLGILCSSHLCTIGWEKICSWSSDLKPGNDHYDS